MSDIKLFKIYGAKTEEIPGSAPVLEKKLQILIERNLDTLLGMRFLATEYSTGKTHGGRIDTLALDENNCPVILEYKRTINDNVINQGLYYLDWLMDHQGEFTLLVQKKIKKATADLIDWTAPRLVCIASDFTKFDEHAVQQINRNIDLFRYRIFGPELLLLELANGVTAIAQPKSAKVGRGKSANDKTVAEWFQTMPTTMRDQFDSLEMFVNSLGDDVQRKDLSLYVAFKRIKNFVTVVFKKNGMFLYVNINPKPEDLIPNFTRDVTKIGHWGTGNLEITVNTEADLERAKPFILQAYEGIQRTG